MPNKLVELVDGEYKFDRAKIQKVFPNADELTPKNLYEIIEPNLRTANQKNALRQVINAYTMGYMDMAGKYDDLFLYHCKTLAQEGSVESLQSLFSYLDETLIPAYKRFAHNSKKTDYMGSADTYVKSVIEDFDNGIVQDADYDKNAVRKTNVESLINSINTGKKSNSADKAKKTKKAIAPEALQYTNDPDVPDLSDPDSAAWAQNIAKRATDAQGRLSDSDQYKQFLKDARIFADLSKVIPTLKFDGTHFPTDHVFEKDTRVLFGEKINGAPLQQEDVMNAYQKAWSNLVKSAKAYEKFKIETKGFTRNENNKSRSQLRSRSKQKFALMDEIFDSGKRKVPELNKDGKQKSM